MKDKSKQRSCKYCGGRVERTADPIYLFKCRNCGEILLDSEVIKKGKGAKT